MSDPSADAASGAAESAHTSAPTDGMASRTDTTEDKGSPFAAVLDNLPAVLAVIALLAAFIVPIYILFRSQNADKSKEAARQAEIQAKEDAALAKKQAKQDRGQGKKKKGGLARMKKGGGLDDDVGGRTGAVAANDNTDDDDDDDDDDASASRADQRKAQKRAEHRDNVEARHAQREAVREKEEEKDAKRRAKDAEREAKALAREEAERKAAEEREKAKQEEYEKWKDLISIDGAGEDADEAVEEEGLLERFIEYIKTQKVTGIEELGTEFGLKAQDAVDRVQALERMGHITGVVDDRGKFIYITRAEMEAVAKFVQRKGRVRISTLAQESNRLIDLKAKKLEVSEEATEEATDPAAEGA